MRRRSKAGSKAIKAGRHKATPIRSSQPKAPAGRSAKTSGETETARLAGERDEALEREAAMSKVLAAISSSPTDLQPIFQVIVESAVELCKAPNASVFLREGDTLVTSAHVGPFGGMPIGSPWPLNRNWVTGRAVLEAKTIHIPDLFMNDEFPEGKEMARRFGHRATLAVPLLRKGAAIGAILVRRPEARPFTEKQIELVKNFAAQAVITIEITRLLTELRQSLEQQTAASEVLHVISRSPGDLKPVFQTMLENATRICHAKFGVLQLYESRAFRIGAIHNAPPAFAEAMARREPLMRPTPEHPFRRMVTTKEVVQIADLTDSPAYKERDYGIVMLVELASARTFLAVPMLKENEVIGVIAIYRQEVRTFTDKQIAVVVNFANQAVIAIENTRLLNELRERTTELERSYGTVRQQASQLEAQSQELKQLNQQLEQRVAEQVGEIERMSRLRRFLSPQVADLIIASGTEKQLESHRREITALYCDLRGFTAFSEAADPEDVIALLREYHAAVGEIINRYSGTLEHYAGDGVMVIFNDPVPVPKPALQAVQAAVDMRQAIGTLTEKWCWLGHDLGFGIGIAHGYATLGTIGFEGRFDYAAIGTVSNVASRLCDEAKPGQILISPRVLMALEDAAIVESIGDFTLKGIRRPLAAYNVLAIKSAS
jgi:class 3 adenylate cyclase/transcriptional regulator with GAF, ATPase, and Fis domain